MARPEIRELLGSVDSKALPEQLDLSAMPDHREIRASLAAKAIRGSPEKLERKAWWVLKVRDPQVHKDFKAMSARPELMELAFKDRLVCKESKGLACRVLRGLLASACKVFRETLDLPEPHQMLLDHRGFKVPMARL
jgi:hypothetical protein